MNCKNCKKQGCSLAGKDHEMSFDCKLYVNGSEYKYDNFKVDPPKVDDGWYLVKDGMTYRVDVPIKKMRFTKSINILTGEVHYPSNADCIRAMTDEELSAFLGSIVHDYGQGTAEIEGAGYVIDDWLAWLREEVTE